MKFEELYKKVIDSCRAFEERQVPIRLDFKIEDLRDALVESSDTIEKLKQKLEDAKATAYAESVDAGMENRRLKRALWLARARAAETGRRFWAKEDIFAQREGRRYDAEKAWKMEKRRERQVDLFNAKAEEYK